MRMKHAILILQRKDKNQKPLKRAQAFQPIAPIDNPTI